MASCVSGDGRENINLSVLLRIMKIFSTKKLATKNKLCWRHMEKLLCWAVQEKMVPARKIVKGLEAKVKERENDNTVSVFTITALSLFRKAGTKEIRHIFRASPAVHTYAPSYVRVPECFPRLFQKESWRRLF